MKQNRIQLSAVLCLCSGVIGCSVAGSHQSLESKPILVESLPLPMESQLAGEQQSVSKSKLIEPAVAVVHQDEMEAKQSTGFAEIFKSREQDSRFATVDASQEKPAIDESIQQVGNSEESVSRKVVLTPSEDLFPLEPVPLVEGGEEWNAGGMTLADFEQMAMHNNPAISQAAAAASEANGVRLQVGLAPNPTVGYFGEEIGNEGSAGLHGAFISQTFVRGGKLAWNRDVLGHDLNAANWKVETQRQRIRTDVKVRFYKALAAQQRLSLARDFLDVTEQGRKLSQDRLEALVGTRPDVLQSEIQVSEAELAIQTAEMELNAAWNELTALVGMPSLTATALLGDLTQYSTDRDFETTYAQITSASPLLASALAEVDRTRSNIQRQKVQAVPNVTAQFGVGRDDGTGDGFANVQLSMPLPVRNQNQGNIRAAQAEHCTAVKNVERIKMAIRHDLAAVMQDYQIALASVKQYENSILPKAKETLSLMQEAQVAGEFDFLRVLTARRSYFEANSEYISAQNRLAQANARIEGLLLTGGLTYAVTYEGGDDLRGQALSGQ